MGNSSRLDSGEYDPRRTRSGSGGLLADRRVQRARTRSGAGRHGGAESKCILFFKVAFCVRLLHRKRRMAFWRPGAVARQSMYFLSDETR